MSYESPAKILYNSDGIESAVTGGIAVPLSTSAYLFAGMTTTGTASYVQTDGAGRLVITGSISTTPGAVDQGSAGTQAQGWYVRITNGTDVLGTGSSSPLYVTGTVSLDGTSTVTGSVSVLNTVTITGSASVLNTVNVTGSVGISNFPVTQSVTGSVGISGIATVTGSVSVLNTVTITGTVTQGNAGSQAQGWYTRITDGTNVLGTGSSAPIFVENAIHTGSVVTPIAATTSVVALVPSSSQTRRGVTLYNDSNKSAAVLYGSGTVNTTNNFSIKLAAGGYLEVPDNFNGPLYAIWVSTATGNMLVTEIFS